ncbi:hypothetical protein [Piscinibacter sp. XHJ-5]|uniref:hypothetical protein n=1 Tax=Piscinibacter sp. XHJ-5 TaxID=3037797 RepID=UPI0024531694|nr:hypothetical protein [Piscinibacter sp. XHJ-5]
MNAKTLITALSLAVIGQAALAVEAEQFTPAPSTLTRAEAQSQQSAAVTFTEATVFAETPAAGVSREEVRAQARAAAHDASFNALYAG